MFDTTEPCIGEFVGMRGGYLEEIWPLQEIIKRSRQVCPGRAGNLIVRETFLAQRNRDVHNLTFCRAGLILARGCHEFPCA